MNQSADKTYIAIDYGTRRIGVAKSDPTGLIASALVTLEVASENQAAKEIAELLTQEGTSVCAATVRTRLKAAGFKLSRGARKADISSEEIVALYVDAGKNLSDTAHELGISVVTLRARMTEFQIPVRKRGRQAAPVEVEVVLDDAAESV